MNWLRRLLDHIADTWDIEWTDDPPPMEGDDD